MESKGIQPGWDQQRTGPGSRQPASLARVLSNYPLCWSLSEAATPAHACPWPSVPALTPQFPRPPFTALQEWLNSVSQPRFKTLGIETLASPTANPIGSSQEGSILWSKCDSGPGSEQGQLSGKGSRGWETPHLCLLLHSAENEFACPYAWIPGTFHLCESLESEMKYSHFLWRW